jgi:hypothetical protein
LNNSDEEEEYTEESTERLIREKIERYEEKMYRAEYNR